RSSQKLVSTKSAASMRNWLPKLSGQLAGGDLLREPLSHSSLSIGANGLVLVFENFEDGKQLCNLQQLTYTVGQPGQFNAAAGAAGRSIKPNQRPQAAAVNVSDSAQVNNELLAVLREEVFDLLPQGDGFLTEHDPAGAVHYRNSVHGSRTQFQIHVTLLLLKAVKPSRGAEKLGGKRTPACSRMQAARTCGRSWRRAARTGTAAALHLPSGCHIIEGLS